eukprot:10514443-Ditylum_brightwellii.AAC.1
MLRRVAVPDVGKIPSKETEIMQTSRGLIKEQCEQILKSECLTPLQQEYLSWHHCLSHMLKSKMKILYRLGILPQRILKLFDENLVPLCGSCVFGTSHRKPWRSKASSKSICCDKDNQPIVGTSTGQMISGQPGLVPQISGHLTNRRIQGATIYSDYYSDFIYVHLMESMSGKETLQSKCAYEKMAAAHGVHVKRYHSDNGRFGEESFRAACNEQ